MNRKTRAILSLAVLLSLGTAAPAWAAEAPPAPQVQQQEPDFVTTADQAIRDVRTVGFVDTDGSKLKAIVLSYDRPIPAAAVDASTFAIEDYGMTLREQDLTQGTSPGALKRVYVNDVPDTDAAGGKASGSYVILEVNTDYQTGRFPRSYAITMYAGVTQQKAIRTAEGIILPSDQAVTNYTKETYVGYDPQTGKSRPPESYKAVRNRSRPDLRQRPVHGRHDGHGDGGAARQLLCGAAAHELQVGQQLQQGVPVQRHVVLQHAGRRETRLAEGQRRDLVLDDKTTASKRDASIRRLVSEPNETGIYQAVLTGNVSHMSAWFYGHDTPACYDWMLKQTRQTEMARPKLPLNRPFALADSQKKTADHIYSVDRQDPSKVVYYPTGKRGSGTEGYNSGVTALGSAASLPPGWTPDNPAPKAK